MNHDKRILSSAMPGNLPRLPTPVIIVSGSTQEGNEMSARALALGAVDCYAKSGGGVGLEDAGRLAQMIREASKVEFTTRAPAVRKVVQEARGSLIERPALIAIGSSTGGVEALQTVLGSFPADCPPTVIVQHINARFAPAVARTLDQSCPPKVLIAEPDLPLKQGHVYLAPGDERHLSVGGTTTFHCKLRPGDPVSGHQPSVDVLFASVAEVVGARAVGILLTGMGADGAQGLLAMARKGAHTIAQDEATCTVFGMPRAAINLGAANVVAPLGSIARHLFSKAA